MPASLYAHARYESDSLNANCQVAPACPWLRNSSSFWSLEGIHLHPKFSMGMTFFHSLGLTFSCEIGKCGQSSSTHQSVSFCRNTWGSRTRLQFGGRSMWDLSSHLLSWAGLFPAAVQSNPSSKTQVCSAEVLAGGMLH